DRNDDQQLDQREGRTLPSHQNLPTPVRGLLGPQGMVKSNVFGPPLITSRTCVLAVLYSFGRRSFATGNGAPRGPPGGACCLGSPEEITTLYLPGFSPFIFSTVYLPCWIGPPEVVSCPSAGRN